MPSALLPPELARAVEDGHYTFHEALQIVIQERTACPPLGHSTGVLPATHWPLQSTIIAPEPQPFGRAVRRATWLELLVALCIVLWHTVFRGRQSSV